MPRQKRGQTIQPFDSTALEGLVAEVVGKQAGAALEAAEVAAAKGEGPDPDLDTRGLVTSLVKGQQIETIRWRCARDPWFFKQHFIKTVDEHDALTPVKPIPSWAHLAYVTEVIQKNDIILIEKARQVFMTWTVLADLLHTALFQPHARIYVQSKKLEEACEHVSMRTSGGSKYGRGRIKSMYDNLLPGLFTEAEWYHGEVQMANGAVIKALASGEEQTRQHTLTRFFADEASRIPEFEDSWVAARPSTEGGGKLIAVTTPHGKEAFYYMLKDLRGSGTVREPVPGLRIEECPNRMAIITLHWWVVPGRDALWYANATRAMPPAKARQELDIDYGVFEGMPVYPQFRRESHVRTLEYRPDCPVVRSWDFGYKRAVVIFGQVVGRSLHVLHGVLEKQASTKMLAEHVMRDSEAMFHGATFEDVCDPAGYADRGSSGSSSLEILESYPFTISPMWRKARIESGVDVISKLLQENRFAVNQTQSLEPLLDALSGGYSFSETGEAPKKDGIHDHWADALRYLVDNQFDAADDPIPQEALSEEKVIELATQKVYDQSRRLREQWQDYQALISVGARQRSAKRSPSRG